MPIPSSSVHQAAADWMQGEESTWSPSRSGMAPSLGAQAMGGFQAVQPNPPIPAPRNLSMQTGGMMSRDAVAMGSSLGNAGQYPAFVDTLPQDVSSAVPAAAPPSPPPLVVMGRESKRLAKEQQIQVAGQPVDSFMQGFAKPEAPGLGGKVSAKTTRAQRVAERMARSGTLNSNTVGHGSGQDEVKLQQSQLFRRNAAEKMQRAFRTHVKYVQANRNRIRCEHSAATKIQARWRAYHVRRQRLGKAAVCIQRNMRGCLVRLAIRRHNAAVVIQRHAMGLLARKHLREVSEAATAVQKVARSRLARKQVKAYEKNRRESTIRIQQSMRRWKANRVVKQRREQRDAGKARVQAAIKIQSVQRGIVGRNKAALRKRTHLAELEEHRAALRIQATVRQKQASERVDSMRNMRLQGMDKAATIIRKHWLCFIHRQRYLELRQEFLLHVRSIVTMQRYVRGFLVRLRMWRDAIRAEEELWAAVEIQRVWRGYMGRLRWELAYESVWSREVAASRLQRYIRGWLARTRVHRMRRKLARAEFEKARKRFKAAQKIQSSIRAWIVRRKTVAWRHRIVTVVTTIQRILRGHQLRSKLWRCVLEKRAVQLQALSRGFIIKNRRFHFVANVICIQRHYRMWLTSVPEAERKWRVEIRRVRRAAARDRECLAFAQSLDLGTTPGAMAGVAPTCVM